MEAGTIPSGPAPKLLLGGATAALAIFIGSLLGIAVLLGSSPGCDLGESVGGLKREVPQRLVPIYEEAAARFKLGDKGPSVLASINFVETDFGANVASSSAGAIGWMQFMPATWGQWGVDANGDGVKDPNDPEDAIFAAASYLRGSGAPGNWRDAIFAYNHADWYVSKVLRYARRFASGTPVETGASCAAAAVAPNEAVAQMLAEAERLSLQRPHTQYVWGGSHGESPTPANGPFDCSSAVSHLLQVGGFQNPTMATPQLATWGEPGPGRWITIWVKPYDDHGAAHTFIEFMPGIAPAPHRFWGTSGFVAPGHGPGWIAQATFSAEYLSYFDQRHPPGL
jgi:transglycosylase-like protein with SLT domain